MQFDLIIIGGGMVGAGLAASLVESNLKIALVDAKMPSNRDARLFALNQSSCTFLQNLNLWQALSEHAAAIHEVHVSKSGSFGAVRLTREDVALSQLGAVIPARYIEAALNEQIAKQPQITFFRPAELQALERMDDDQNVLQNKASIRLQDETIEIMAPLIVGADGADSSVRKCLNIPADEVDYQETAIVTRIHLQRSHHHVAYERFLTDGAIAMLPLPDNTCATIWTTHHDKAKALLALSDEEFIASLQKQFGYRLGRMLSVAERHHYPLRMVCAKEIVHQGALLLGNAAHTLHPIAAQGFNLALYEVALLVNALQQGKPLDVEAFHLARKKQMQTSIKVSHQLSAMVRDASWLMKNLLPLGFVGMDKVAPLRRKFIANMLGLTNHPPSLLLNSGEV